MTHLMLVMHAHLPFVRHPEHENFLEEKWLFEAITETYIPLLDVFARLLDDGVPYKLTLSISTTLAAMLQDDLLGERYLTHLSRCIELGEKEVQRTVGDPDFAPLAELYLNRFLHAREVFETRYEGRILKGFDYFQKKGRLELITTVGTHPFLPNYRHFPQVVSAQMELGIDSHASVFGKAPRGIWLPECGYYEGLEEQIKANGLQYFFSAAHGVLFGSEVPRNGTYAPVRTPNGVAVFPRDLFTANQVWSSQEGYPGDPVYRDFYRDIGHDLPKEYIGPYIHEGTVRINTGFKYYAITDKSENKVPYQPQLALERLTEHARHFVDSQERLSQELSALMEVDPVITSPYDAELFGHWWFEGPQWFEAVVREIAARDNSVDMSTPSRYLKQNSPEQQIEPAFSSWGNKGYAEVWLDGTNDWIYRHTHKAIERMAELIERFPNETGLKRRALNQAAREVLLSQGSDWPFIMNARTVVPYATSRVKEHLANFNRIYEALSGGQMGTEWLTKLEKKNNIFPDIDYQILRGASETMLQV
ncbi:MAG: glycoside hydrolase family 57 protein [Spirochaetaceae bacterium]